MKTFIFALIAFFLVLVGGYFFQIVGVLSAVILAGMLAYIKGISAKELNDIMPMVVLLMLVTVFLNTVQL